MDKCKCCWWQWKVYWYDLKKQENFLWVVCDDCFDILDRYDYGRKYTTFLPMMDKVILYKKCLWKNKKQKRKITRNYINYCWFRSFRKDWKEYKIKF